MVYLGTYVNSSTRQNFIYSSHVPIHLCEPWKGTAQFVQKTVQMVLKQVKRVSTKDKVYHKQP